MTDRGEGRRICVSVCLVESDCLFIWGTKLEAKSGCKRCRSCIISFDVTSDSSLSRVPCGILWCVFWCFHSPPKFLYVWYSILLCYGFDITPYTVDFSIRKCIASDSNSCEYFTLSYTLFDSLFKTMWHMNSACQIHSGEPAESTLRRLSAPAPLYSIINMIDGAQSQNPVWGHVMATGACPV